MNIICLETSTKNCSVALSVEGQCVAYCEEFDENYSHSAKLHSFIEKTIDQAKCSINLIDAVCVGKGPGSYTGLRIGVACAKGLAYALDIPLLSLDSLFIMASAVKSKKGILIPMIDARRKEVYSAVYDEKLSVIQPIKPIILSKNSFNELSAKHMKCSIFGDGAIKAREIIDMTYFDFIPEVHPSAIYMCFEAHMKLKSGSIENIGTFEPLYLKDFQVS